MRGACLPEICLTIDCEGRMGWVIGGYVRRGGGKAQKAFWTGTSWSKKAPKVYGSRQEAQRATDRINVQTVESVAIYPIQFGRPTDKWLIE